MKMCNKEVIEAKKVMFKVLEVSMYYKVSGRLGKR